jgi:exodeoxyribonuclease V alpha subunit
VANNQHATLSGVLERILYHNDENEYCVGELSPSDGGPTVTITGKLPGVQCGETLEMEGTWDHHPKFGQQFKIQSYQTRLPSTVHGIRKYLSSGLIEGIGKVYANKIVDHFGADTLDVITHFAGKLRDVPGIGAKRAKQIKKAWEAQHALREVMIFLQTYGVGTAQCIRLVKKYGDETRDILQNQPYRLAREVDGIGFLTADKIALNLGFSSEGIERLDAGILHTLHVLEGDGHTCVPIVDLVQASQELLKVKPQALEKRIQNLLQNDVLLSPPPGNQLVQSTSLYRSEMKIAEAFHLLLSGDSRLPSIKIDLAIDWAQEKAGFKFAPQQAEALRMALQNKVCVLTGGPGTGKTTILRALVSILKAKKVRIVLGSPTGRAAQRLAESSRHPAQTLHRILKYEPADNAFYYNSERAIPCDYIIVDEASMLDTRLGAALFSALDSGTHLLLVGDIDQLPSVGAGNLLKDLIESRRAAVTKLETIFRQDSDSTIVTTAHNILSGSIHLPDPGIQPVGHDIHYLQVQDAQECVDQTVALCTKILPERGYNPKTEVQVLAPMHKGVAGIHNLNAVLQAQLNPNKGHKSSSGPQNFQAGDKVIQLRNNYDKNLFNGDVGFILSVDPETGVFQAEFNGEVQTFEKSESSDLALAYAISIHKSQGSEYPVVILPIMKQHFMMLQRNLIYTGVTRGKKEVFLIGQPEAYAIAVKNSKSQIRKTHLKEKIHRYASSSK